MSARVSSVPVATGGPVLDRTTVWVLEDSPLEAEMARRALAPSHAVELFDDGMALLERVSNGERPAALVIDLALPGLSGVEVCRLLRQRDDEMVLPILILTALGHREDIMEGLGAGANDYLTKPYDVVELRARVDTLARTSRLHAAQRRRTAHLALWANVASTLTRGGNLVEVGGRCVHVLAEHFGAAMGIWRLDGGASLVAAAGECCDASTIEPMIDRLRRNELVTLPPVAAPGADPALQPQAVAAFPLTVEGAPQYLLTASTASPLDADVLELIRTMSGTIAVGLERARVEALNRDLLERERAARADAETANRSKDDFLAVVSHELRTPLNAISGWTRMLSSGQIPPDRLKRALGVIERNAAAQAQLIEDLLDVSRIVTGKLSLNIAMIDMVDVVGMAREALRPAAEAKGVQIVEELPTEPCIVAGDIDRLQQVIWNLVSNAVKFTGAGGRVTVRLASRGDQVVLDVEDTGQGIAPEFLPHVFDRFRQADASKTRSHGGLGLGLAIVRHIVEAHGGQVEAASEGVGRGATFQVTLRRAETHRQVASLSAVRGAASLAGVRVLVVEDDVDSREMLVSILEGAGATVRTAADAREATARLDEQVPDVIVSDIGLPGEDGLSFLRRVRRLSTDAARIPAIAVTAYAREEDRADAFAAGFDAYLRKPVEGTELTSLVAQVHASRAR